MMIWEIRSIKKNGLTMFFYYDSEGNPIAFSYNVCMHYSVKNIQGDILGLVNKNGTIIARYEYDAFGKILSVKNRFGNEITSPTSTAHMNPLRYRGYIYDEETSLYYLKSRYYDPYTGRFLSLDSLVDTQKKTPLSVNMYSYCENDFINKKDSTGYVMESNLEPHHYNDHENVLIKSGLTNCVNFSEYYYVGQYRSNGYMIYTYHKRGSSVMSSAAYILSFYTQTKYRSEWESDAKHLRDEANAISSVGNMMLELFSFGTFCIEETYPDWTTFVPYSDYICLGIFLGSVLFNAYMTVFNPSIDYNSKKATYILRNVSQTNWTTKIEIALFAVLSYVSIGCTPTVVGEQHIYEPY